jgi:ribosomal protein S18 acetylase RimI-like enzyme
VHPRFQGRGLGGEIVDRLVELSSAHNKIILYANPGTEGFYKKRGFRRMLTAMAIFADRDSAVARGVIDGT